MFEHVYVCKERAIDIFFIRLENYPGISFSENTKIAFSYRVNKCVEKEKEKKKNRMSYILSNVPLPERLPGSNVFSIRSVIADVPVKGGFKWTCEF